MIFILVEDLSAMQCKQAYCKPSVFIAAHLEMSLNRYADN